MIIFLLIVIAIGVMFIFDARNIGDKYFSSNDSNKVSKIIKLIGIVISLTAGVVLVVI